MTIFGQPQGNPPSVLKACAGTPVVVDLVALLAGTTQNTYVASSDYQIVSNASASHKEITIPDPNKYGGTAGDSFFIVNGQSGQTISVFPPTGGNIDATGSNTAISVSQGATAAIILQSYTSTTSVWIADGGS